MQSISQENFELELQSLLRDINYQIQTSSRHLEMTKQEERGVNDLAKLNVLKVQRMKLQSVYNNIQQLSEKEWLENKDVWTEIYKNAAAALQNKEIFN